MQECCNFLNAFVPSSTLTPSGPKILCTHTVGADARHRPAWTGVAGRCKHRPLHPLYRWYCREGSCPFLAPFPFIANIKHRCRGRRPRRPGRGLGYCPWRGQDPSLRTNFNPSVTAAPCHLPLHKGGFYSTSFSSSSARLDGRCGAMQASPPTNSGTPCCRGEHCSPVNVEIRQTAAGAHCAPLHPL